MFITTGKLFLKKSCNKKLWCLGLGLVFSLSSESKVLLLLLLKKQFPLHSEGIKVQVRSLLRTDLGVLLFDERQLLPKSYSRYHQTKQVGNVSNVRLLTKFRLLSLLIYKGESLRPLRSTPEGLNNTDFFHEIEAWQNPIQKLMSITLNSPTVPSSSSSSFDLVFPR